MNKRFYIVVLSVLLGCWAITAEVKADSALSSYIEMDYSGKADTLTNVLTRQFLNASKGTFWAVPRDRSDRESQTTYIYWQQAHAMNVLVYSYERIKDSNPSTASNYQRYMEQWYRNHANNWYHDNNDPTGFVNEYTDDMCWICLTLLHMSEALGDDKYAETVKTLFDDYIEPRGWADGSGFWGLPWKSNDMGRNACTNAPGCLVACKLYEKYGDEKYLKRAKDIYDYQENEMKTNLNNDGKVEDPPLTYTQGTFGEACRHLYHITGDAKYMTMAQKVIYYVCTSNRCVDRGILRHEGTTMDQSIFKAVAIPYIVNMTLDEDVSLSYRRQFVRFLQNNAKKLWANMDLSKYPACYCNYYWGEPFDYSTVASMGAMTSGASLMENVARMALVLKPELAGIGQIEMAKREGPIYNINGVVVGNTADTPLNSLPKGIYVVDGKKTVVRGK